MCRVQLCVLQQKFICSFCVSTLPSSWPHGQTLSLPAAPLLWAALWGLGHAGLPAERLLSSGSRGELGGGRYRGDRGGPDQLRGGEERTIQQKQHLKSEPGEMDERRAVLLQGRPSWPQPDPDHPKEPLWGLEAERGPEQELLVGEQENLLLSSIWARMLGRETKPCVTLNNTAVKCSTIT